MLKHRKGGIFMKYDEKFKYAFINKEIFDSKYLEIQFDGSKYKKYILVYYKDNKEIKYTTIPNQSYLHKFKNVINTYDVEEIISTCINFDNMYESLQYFHIKDTYFIKYQADDEIIKLLNISDDSKIIKDFLDYLV